MISVHKNFFIYGIFFLKQKINYKFGELFIVTYNNAFQRRRQTWSGSRNFVNPCADICDLRFTGRYVWHGLNAALVLKTQKNSIPLRPS